MNVDSVTLQSSSPSSDSPAASGRITKEAVSPGFAPAKLLTSSGWPLTVIAAFSPFTASTLASRKLASPIKSATNLDLG